MVNGVSDTALSKIWNIINSNGRLTYTEKQVIAESEGVCIGKIECVTRVMKAAKLYGVDDADKFISHEDNRRSKYIINWLKHHRVILPQTTNIDTLRILIQDMIENEKNNIENLTRLLDTLNNGE